MAGKAGKRFTIYEGNILLVTLFRLVVVLVLFFLSRVCFCLFNFGYFSDLGFGELFRIFFSGIRFDISAILIINAPFILMNTLPFRLRFNRIYQGFANGWFYVVNTIGLAANFIDLIYFRFTLKRTTADIFRYLGVGGDFDKLIPQFLRDFWYILLLWILFIVLFVWLSRRFRILTRKGKKSGMGAMEMVSGIFLLIFAGFFTVIGIRGGFQRRPIGIVTAGNYTSAKYVPLLLNTPFSIARTVGDESLKTERFYPSEKELSGVYDPVHRADSGGFRRMNVMIILMESFSSEHVGALNMEFETVTYKGFTPFLDSLSRHGLLLNGYANGKTSIQGIPAVLSSIPSLMNESYIQSVYSTNKINSLAGLLKTEGYSTAFFHGGTNGTMGFDSYSKYTGFDAYYGRSEYGNEKDYDGKWGIRDEEFFQFVKKQIDRMKPPFLTALFSLSSHHPYYVPEKYKGKFRKGDLPIQESIMYADFSLGRFFSEAKKMPWYENTLFVITADHTSEGYGRFYKTDAGQYAIPILFFTPREKVKGNEHEIASQTDILPSVLDYLNYDKDYVAFGNSVFDSVAPRFSVHFISGLYGIIKDGFLLEFDGTRTTSFFDMEIDPFQESNLAEKNLPEMDSLEHFLKAYLQQYNNRIIENRMVAD